MKTKQILAALTVLLVLFSTLPGRAATVTATGSGNWDSTTADAPWPLGTVPASGDDAVINSGFTVTVVSPATIHNLTINTGGSVVNTSTLSVGGSVSGAGTFNATAVGN